MNPEKKTAQAKKELRRRMKEHLRHLPADQRQRENKALLTSLRTIPGLRSFRSPPPSLPAPPAKPAKPRFTAVLAYYPLPQEADIRPLLQELLAADHTVGLPRIGGRPGEMSFHKIPDLTGLDKNRWGLWEPAAQSPRLDPLPPSGLVLVPGLAFDSRGYRLGRGGGYYDRFLNTLPPDWQTAAPIFSCQWVEEVPRESFDARVDYLASPDGLHRTSET